MASRIHFETNSRPRRKTYCCRSQAVASPETPEPTTAAVLPLPFVAAASFVAAPVGAFSGAAATAAAATEGPTLGILDLERRNAIANRKAATLETKQEGNRIEWFGRKSGTTFLRRKTLLPSFLFFFFRISFLVYNRLAALRYIWKYSSVVVMVSVEYRSDPIWCLVEAVLTLVVF